MRSFVGALVSGVLVTLMLVLAVAALHLEDSRVAAEPADTENSPVLIDAPPVEPFDPPSQVSFSEPAEIEDSLLEPNIDESSAMSSSSNRDDAPALTAMLPSLTKLRAGTGGGASAGAGGSGQGDGAASGSAVEPAQKVFGPKVEYPVEAFKAGLEGVVRVLLRIEADGRVSSVKVLDSEPPGVFDQAAIDAARRYRFVPAQSRGKAIATNAVQSFIFEIVK